MDKRGYFVINRARQYGKTTTLNELRKALRLAKASEEYIGAWDDSGVTRIHLLSRHITKMCEKEKLVLLIDEVDRTSNNRVFIHLIDMLRDKFLARKANDDHIFHSVIFAGVYDIKNIKNLCSTPLNAARKRHIVTDTMGNLLAVFVHAANIHDTKSGIDPARIAYKKYPTIQKFCGDDGYRKSFEEAVATELGVGVDISTRKTPQFEVLPFRWVVERTFGWSNHSRRLSKDYEIKTVHEENML